jgi:hypothetical protein
MLNANSQETKNRLCEWIIQLNAEAVLKEINMDKVVTEDNLEILRNQFPKSKYLK